MSQEAYKKYITQVHEDTLVIIDEDLVTPVGTENNRTLMMPATRFANELGWAAVANVVMLGFLTATTSILPADAMKKSILASVPPRTGELNLSAFEKGFEHAKSTVS
jgi:2-oxoglutarate ferredoxin oxidoreductase subunit gamma